MSDADAELARLRELWQRESETSRARLLEDRARHPLKERVARGIALRGLAVDDVELGGGGLLVWLRPQPIPDHPLRARPGTPVVLWRDQPEEEGAVRAVLGRQEATRVAVHLRRERDLEALEEPGFRLDFAATDATAARGLAALERFAGAGEEERLGQLRAILFGGRPPEPGEPAPLQARDVELTADQREAVAGALAAPDLYLIHGPPGTGKTRTLVELVRAAAARGERVLACAPSNAAVDNLCEQLAARGVEVVRLGHPARVAPAVQGCSLDARLAADPGYKLATGWLEDARRARARAEKRAARGNLSHSERRAAFREASKLLRDARSHLRGLRVHCLASAPALATTAAGAATRMLDGQRFDLVILDEASQATDPIALVPLSRAGRVVLAGDHQQLPPTVVDREAARGGLSRTLFERLIARPEVPQTLLRVQHRMDEILMQFPSESKYDGLLLAAPAVASQRLEELPGVGPDPLRPGPLVFVDCAGKGWAERRFGDDPSTSNPEQARRVAAEARRVLSRGLPASALAIITPYDAQVRELRGRLADELAAGLEIGTVDGFQGREKEAIIVDLVRCNPKGELGFLRDTRRLNVALTRARRLLIVVGDSATLGAHPYYAGFLEAAEAFDGYISAWDDEAERLG